MRRAVRNAFCSIILASGLAVLVEACGIDVTFRAYLDQTFWRPTLTYVAELARNLPKEKGNYLPYAGMSMGRGNSAVQTVRDFYQSQFRDDPYPELNFPTAVIDRLRDLLTAIQTTRDAESHEVDLLRCKVELRAARIGDDASFARVQSCLESYLNRPRPLALTSEARG